MGFGLAEQGMRYCPPDKVSGVQATAIVEKYMRDHPEKLNNAVNAIIPLALLEAFPCDGTKR